MGEGNLSQIFIPPAVMAIMFGMGLELVWDDFRRVGRAPKNVVIGVATQLVGLPLLGFALIALAPLNPAMAFGIMLLTLSPGGVMSNYFATLAKADVALSVTLTAVSGVIAIFTLPVVAHFAMALIFGSAEALPIGGTMAVLFIVGLFPIAVGMLFRAHLPTLANTLLPYVKKISVPLLLALITISFVEKYDAIIDNLTSVVPYVLLLNGATLLLAWIVGRLSGVGLHQRISYMLEIGIQNPGLATIIAFTILQRPEFAIPAFIYAATMYLTGLVVVKVARDLVARHQAQTATIKH